MSKRSLNVLLVVIILVLIAGIIGFSVSVDFQEWVHTWLGDPAGLAATATTVAALATLLAVIVGLRGITIGRELAREAFEQAEQAREESRQQFLEALYNDSRPLVVPTAPDLTEQYEAEEPITFDWNASTTFVTIQNVGAGVATNIWIAILPPASAEGGAQYVSRLGSPLAAGSSPVKVYLGQGALLFRESDRLNEHSLSLPAEGSQGRGDHFLARLSITYQDIFGRKHASIFDLSDRGLWVNVAFVANVARDLGEINSGRASAMAAAPAQR